MLKELHRKSPARHFAIALRQFALLAAASLVSWKFPQPWIWIPSAIVAGWTAFNFTVLLHDVVHRAIWNGPRPRAERVLSILYAVPSGISGLQFTRWHLTHHAELGDAEADPKRHYLSPKIEPRLVQAALLHTGPLPHLLPRGGEGDGELPAGAAPADRP